MTDDAYRCGFNLPTGKEREREETEKISHILSTARNQQKHKKIISEYFRSLEILNIHKLICTCVYFVFNFLLLAS